MRRRLALGNVAGILVMWAGAGCHNCCPNRYTSPPVFGNTPPGRPGPPGPLLPGTPPPLPGGYSNPVVPPAPVPVSPEVRNYYTPPNPNWRPPSNPGARLYSPEPPGAAPRRESVRLYAPEPDNASSLAVPPKTVEPPPAASLPSSPLAPFPVGIPQFAMVKERVYSGLKPALEDGLDWLKANGYRSVLHLRAAGEEDLADERQVEKRGLNFRSLEVSPQTLGPKLVDDFNALVDDAKAQPLFVYDKDGELAGAMWYLHFRAAGESDEAARSKALRLGLKESMDDEHRTLWVAVQKYLNERK